MPCIDVSVLGYVIRLRNHVAALVDEKEVGREVPNEEQIFCKRSECRMNDKTTLLQIGDDVQAATSHHVIK